MTFESGPNSPEHKAVNPILKFVLELGPLGVFFFANARGEELAATFPALAALNEIVWRTTAALGFSDNVWVNFKVFGIMPITFVFALTQLPLINRYTIPEEGKKAS